MYKVKFTKIKNNHNRLRTDEVVGYTSELPEFNKPFVMSSTGLEFGTRVVATSVVKLVHTTEEEKEYELHTESGSIYKIEVLGKIDEKHG